MERDVIVSVGDDLRIVGLNAAAEALFGSDVVGRPVTVLRTQEAELAALQEAAAVRDTFLHAVSHELRTPLTVVVGCASLLADETVTLKPSEATDLIRRLLSNAEKLERLLSDLLDLDRLARGVMEPRRRPTDVGLVLRTVVEYLDAGDHPVDIEVDTGLMASVDAAQLERIVENLLANCLRHTAPGTAVSVGAQGTDDGLLVCVNDRGPGVPDPEKSVVFEAFQRGAAAKDVPGTGIGLSLVARFAALHGGRAWVEDRPGGGASFKVLLPEA
jgi:two-component system, OmpR family, sensor histidine kinase KdpD